MLKFWLKVLVYLICFIFSMFGLSALDYNRFLKKGKPANGQILFYLLAFALAYLVGNFLMGIIYYFN